MRETNNLVAVLWEEDHPNEIVGLEGLKNEWELLRQSFLSTRSDLDSKLASLKQEFIDTERIVEVAARAAQSAATSLDAAMTELEEYFEADVATAISDAKGRASDAAETLGDAARKLWYEELKAMTGEFRELEESRGQRIDENVGERLGELREAFDEVFSEFKDVLENAGTGTATDLKDAGASIKEFGHFGGQHDRRI